MILLRKPIQRSLAAFPTRIPEFLATGNPLITNDVMDIPLYLSDGNHAHVVPAGRPECIAERLIAINEDPTGSRRIGDSGRVRLDECFDYRPLTEKVAHFLKGLP
jgi:glycosyltransferase involved in cell wall biosynthesis